MIVRFGTIKTNEIVVKFFYKPLDIWLVNPYTKSGKDKQRCMINRIKELNHQK